MDYPRALNPKNSVVVEACAGSGKTWLLVSRIVRLLLEGVPPSEILAITFTRKAAQEMQGRLRDWLYELATKDDAYCREFLLQRAIAPQELDVMLPRARRLYQAFLLAQPPLTINTFHGWFMQILKRAPLNAGAGGVQLLEQTGALRQEAMQLFLDNLQKDPDGETAQAMLYLFKELGLSNTQGLLATFAAKCSEWWAFTAGQADPVAFAMAQLRAELNVMTGDPVAAAFSHPDPSTSLRTEGEGQGASTSSARTGLSELVRSFAGVLNASAAQKTKSDSLLTALEAQDFAALWTECFTQQGKPRSLKANKGQDADAFLAAGEALVSALLAVDEQRTAQKIEQLNAAGLRCGAALLDCYQQLKSPALDFTDLEWRVRQLLVNSDHAEYLQYKLDSRYRHVLLDEFQDTNPLQWQILQAWFDASKAVGSLPTVFVVGDPKQSIYRFRRADARLFGVVREQLRKSGAICLSQNTTRRNAPAILAAVNGVFLPLAQRGEGEAQYEGFETHESAQQNLAGWVEVLPLAEAEDSPEVVLTGELRNPLLEAFPAAAAGAREGEAAQLADKILEIVGQWQINDEGRTRPAEFGDIMVLVRRRTHLKIYEAALRDRHIPHLTSRRGGLLDTLEALDIQALLTFLMTPFADLPLAHTLRSPIFGCTDDDLMAVEAVPEVKTWWKKLQFWVESGNAAPNLQRAHGLLADWLNWAEKLPVHDLLDKIYFQGDAQARYAAASDNALRATVLANLQAFIEIALDIDAGRYPSLSGFLRALAELRQADDNESPNEGTLSHAGNALRIYTVHESKGLEAPIVWLLDSNIKPPADRGFDVLVDWQTDSDRPTHFSLYTDKASHGAARAPFFATEEKLAERENLNLLYVAMTRAKQILLVSGNGKLMENSWYQRVSEAVENVGENPFAQHESVDNRANQFAPTMPVDFDSRLTQALPTGNLKPNQTDAQRYGIWLHGLLEKLTEPHGEIPDLQGELQIPETHFSDLLVQAHYILTAPHLVKFFDANQHQTASNEVAYVNADGELRRMDRLVEFENEIWVLDYKSGNPNEAPHYHLQLHEYRAAMQSVYPHKKVRSGLIFGGGEWVEVV
ncbi:MAG: UvrD-helicase domain-containing protein [Gallionella sp.]|nr:UvrD-helicase domain-containing protein [Gallionella sp.]MDD4958311.1 UvrD-helicase domain-containing protein [Gallionella sp.]